MYQMGLPCEEEVVRMEGTPWCWFDFLLKNRIGYLRVYLKMNERSLVPVQELCNREGARVMEIFCV